MSAPTADITKQLSDAGSAPSDAIRIEDPATSDLTAEVAQTYFDLRQHKGVSIETAEKQAQDPLVFAAMLVRNGHADGTVGGAVATTSDTVRAALQVIGKHEGAALVSSFFLMVLPEGHPSGRGGMIYSDCGLVIDPTAEELAAIAQQSAVSCQALMDETPESGDAVVLDQRLSAPPQGRQSDRGHSPGARPSPRVERGRRIAV